MKGFGKTSQVFKEMLEEYVEQEKRNRYAKEYLQRVFEVHIDDSKVDIAYIENAIDILNGDLECVQSKRQTK